MGEDRKKLSWPGWPLAIVTLFAVVGLTACSAPGFKLQQLQSERLIPQTIASLDERFEETSGLAFAAGRIWSVNDSGGAAALQWLMPESGERGELVLTSAVNYDWEALAVSEQNLYVVDCGNNRGDRIWMQLYAVHLDQLNSERASSERTDFRFADVDYSDRRREHNNDCEAATWIDGELWLFTKNWQDQQTRIYTLVPGAARQLLNAKAELAVGGLITGADYSAAHQRLVLLGYGKGLQVLQPFIWIVPLSAGELQWSDARRFDLALSGQWEAVLWQGDQLLLTRENSPLGRAELVRLSLPSTVLRADQE